MSHATIRVAIIAFVPLASGTAQVPIRPGARVRVTGQFCQPFYSNCVGGSPQQYVGTFVAWKFDTLVVQSNGDTLSVPVNLVTRLDVSRGWKRHTGEGFGYGLVLGLVAGGFVGAKTYEPPPPPPCEDFALCIDVLPDLGLVPPFIGAGIGAGIGAVAGALVGFAIKTEQWEEAPLDRLRMSLGPQRDGRFGFGASVKF